MITLEQTGKGLYTLNSILMSFHDTKVTKWYYDINNKLISEKPDFPESLLTRKLSDDDIVFFNKYYLPKVSDNKPQPSNPAFRPYANKLSNDTLQALEREGAYKHFTLEERQGLNLWAKMYELLKPPYEKLFQKNLK